MALSDLAEGPLELGLVGLALSAIGAHNVWQGWTTGNWKPAPGEIIESAIEEVTDERSLASSYKAGIRYTYTVRGKEYEGDTVKRGFFAQWPRFLAQRQVDRYEAGGKVTVYFLPGDPSQAVLERGVAPEAWIHLGSGLVVLYLAYSII